METKIERRNMIISINYIMQIILISQDIIYGSICECLKLRSDIHISFSRVFTERQSDRHLKNVVV
jgi:hypothetical protein